jgi:hypothetical protein
MSQNQTFTNIISSLNDQCIGVFAVFLEYIVHPRNNYFVVSRENVNAGLTKAPMLTSQMVEYCLTNILPFSRVMKGPEVSRSLIPNFVDAAHLKSMFEGKLSSKFKKEYEKLVTIWVEPYALNTYIQFVQKYIYFISIKNNVLDLDDHKNQLERSKNVLTVTALGNPVDYGFKYDSQNYVAGSMIWVLAGLTDWLEKSDVDFIDVNVMTRILIPSGNKIKNFTKDVVESKKEDQIFVEERLYEALSKEDMFPDKQSLTLLANVFVHINGAGDSVVEHAVQYCKSF